MIVMCGCMYIVLFRLDKKQPWKRVGDALTMAEALNLCDGPGEWWFHEPHDEEVEFVKETGNGAKIKTFGFKCQICQ
jgi:hypothetical protein